MERSSVRGTLQEVSWLERLVSSGEPNSEAESASAESDLEFALID